MRNPSCVLVLALQFHLSQAVQAGQMLEQPKLPSPEFMAQTLSPILSRNQSDDPGVFIGYLQLHANVMNPANQLDHMGSEPIESYYPLMTDIAVIQALSGSDKEFKSVASYIDSAHTNESRKVVHKLEYLWSDMSPMMRQHFKQVARYLAKTADLNVEEMGMLFDNAKINGDVAAVVDLGDHAAGLQPRARQPESWKLQRRIKISKSIEVVPDLPYGKSIGYEMASLRSKLRQPTSAKWWQGKYFDAQERVERLQAMKPFLSDETAPVADEMIATIRHLAAVTFNSRFLSKALGELAKELDQTENSTPEGFIAVLRRFRLYQYDEFERYYPSYAGAPGGTAWSYSRRLTSSPTSLRPGQYKSGNSFAVWVQPLKPGSSFVNITAARRMYDGLGVLNFDITKERLYGFALYGKNALSPRREFILTGVRDEQDVRYYSFQYGGLLQSRDERVTLGINVKTGEVRSVDYVGKAAREISPSFHSGPLKTTYIDIHTGPLHPADTKIASKRS